MKLIRIVKMTSFQNVSLLVSFTQLPKHPHSLITVLPEASTLNNAYAVRKVKNKVSNNNKNENNLNL